MRTLGQELSLTNLTLPEFDPEEIRRVGEEIDAEMEIYRNRYGDDWLKRYHADKFPPEDYDRSMKRVNEVIYFGLRGSGWATGSLEYVRYIYGVLSDREYELYGDRYDEFLHHRDKNPYVTELLLQDALRTGKWKELPDEIQEEYHKLTNLEALMRKVDEMERPGIDLDEAEEDSVMI